MTSLLGSCSVVRGDKSAVECGVGYLLVDELQAQRDKAFGLLFLSWPGARIGKDGTESRALFRRNSFGSHTNIAWFLLVS